MNHLVTQCDIANEKKDGIRVTRGLGTNERKNPSLHGCGTTRNSIVPQSDLMCGRALKHLSYAAELALRHPELRSTESSYNMEYQKTMGRILFGGSGS